MLVSVAGLAVAYVVKDDPEPAVNGLQDTVEKDGAGSSSRSPGSSSGSTSDAKRSRTEMVVCFLEGEKLVPVKRADSGKGISARAALIELLSGPTEAERDQGLASAIPAGTTLLDYSVNNGVATVNFSEEIAGVGGGSATVIAITDQVVETVIRNDDAVRTVNIKVAGVPASQALQP